ncbi:tRNA uridine 5-carboxymethylaminomethyl modification enzyme [Caminicella sporogenes DSM 14501]|uniref:tRNA uridine 5-carboxymethylaminomethyl modification enzyme MnmG n=1 Tax=Caminicella sporogenes DSM 14501 TaxID=1121266 RepID=A0A1M6NCK6_9FIRM|nr:tRNA uridine-5-carboxymethylaminomethyl(34) synthesis enzyme MnmG [Caminicella sporogenes]RKD22244.1 tRNA uridine(34) 5-carboxymethylaminomethyl synthesis enzyme MnmG [Caminicella sporogenes]WIF95872.1 tRNA uridine-5-carboxymethylaminomethyl(34) synthesis enzyme MnmG [Caminicella sporogenes]SHJ93475.1 tRNA uridine 5-carboxymethylaminomethyl modification enzyme [Caminicella sporogenes DSM 14501]
MERFEAGSYDVIVVGAGHAGCEACLAAARMGCKTLVLSINLDSIAMMPCNPSIGGTGKGHLVREIDALGGEMGLNIDKAFIQSRMLNTAKGPAVHSLRAQADKHLYHIEMKKTLENEPNLDVKQGEVIELIVENGRVKGVVLKQGSIYYAKAVILATGTYLGGRIFIGQTSYESGPNGLAPSLELTKQLKELGLRIRRFKTGTPARVDRKSLNFEKMQEQPGDEEIVPFSFMNDYLEREQVSCWLSYTNEETHKIIHQNLHRSALYGGKIEGTGPRYCPSIEDKIIRFADKERHQLFIEPEGLDTNEMYVQGMSTSLPEDVQKAFLSTIPGLENVKIMRPAYAIEYDCIDPTQLKLTLECKDIEFLFSCGQFNGSSGYEEAAAQGLIAGINAVLKIQGKEPFILDRSEAYIGVLIDDLVTKGTNEPYRMMTSRAEYRLILRQDNADLRLTEKGYKIGLVTEERYKKYLKRKEEIEREMERLKNTYVKPSEVNEFLERHNSSKINNSISLYDLLKRPEISYDTIKEIDVNRPKVRRDVARQCDIQIKYEGYIQKQLKKINQFKKLEGKKLSPDIDYSKIDGIRLEAREKLNKIKPLSVGQASRISGVSPADISVLLVYLEQQKRRRGEESE